MLKQQLKHTLTKEENPPSSDLRTHQGDRRKPDGEQTVEEVCREHNSNEQIFSRWRRKYGRMETADAKRLKGLCDENSDLKKMLADALLKNRVLEETRSKKG